MKGFPIHFQHDSMQCGIACLQMVCEYYGRKYTLEQLAEKCYATTEGVSLLGISQAAESMGLHTVCGKLTVEQLLPEVLPCILHWNQNHFVVLYRVKRRRYYLADPGRGRVQLDRAEFIAHWVSTKSQGEDKGIAMMLAPTPKFYNQKVRCEKKESFLFLWRYFCQYRKYFFQLFLGLLLECVLQLIMPFLTQCVVDVGIRYKDVKLIELILLGELMIVIGRTATDFIRRQLLLHISMRMNISLVSDFFIKLLHLPMAFFDTKRMGDLLQRMNDHDRIQSFLTTQMLGVMFYLFSLGVFGVILFMYDSMICGVFLLGSVAYILWIKHFLHRRKILDYALFEQQALNQSKTYQFIISMQEIKLQNCEQRRRWEWEDVQADLFAVQMKSLKLQQVQEAGGVFINELKNVGITVIAATAVIDGTLTLGAMLAIQYIIGQLNSPVDRLMDFIYSLQDVKLSLERINEIHLKKDEDSGNKCFDFFGKDRDIRVEHVDFQYDPHALWKTLEDITFTIHGGEITAIVGASGSGKTTLIKLMLGYYSVMAGNILIADRNINNYNLKWWRCQCGVVMQDGMIFSESIARNIAVDDGEVNVERLEKAARIANIHEYIMGLPLKYNTQIGRDGVGLSQGQKQRILIARAVYKNPSFIFLDEATNALDAKNEKVIVENLNKFYKGRTVVVVAHRLSTVKNANQIVVLDNGKVVEIGNHVSLIKKQGVYYNLVRDQLELGN